MEDIIDIIVTETTNLIEITSQPTDEIIDVNIIDNREDVTLNVTPTVVEININSLTGSFGVNWGDITGTLANQTDLNTALGLKADLVGGKVPSSQLPSYVDDVVEVANYAALPATGETGKIYITLDTNKIYRWSGSAYIEIADSTAVWGAITGTLSSQTDLQSALDAKQNQLNGTGFVKASGTTITYDNSTYLTTSSAASTYVPYTGATGNVDLGTHTLSSHDLVVNHGSGSGVAVSITKGGSGEALTVVKSSGSGNAASITGGTTLLSELNVTGGITGTTVALTTSTLVDGLLVNNGSGRGIRVINAGAGYGIIINNETASSAIPFLIQKNGANKISFTDAGGATYSDRINTPTLYATGSSSEASVTIAQNASYHALSITQSGIGNAIYATGAVTIVGTTNISGQLTLGSTITNSSGYTYTLPSATGTLALTSNLSSYLPLSGGTLTGALTIGPLDGQALKMQAGTSTGNSYLRFYNSASASRGYFGLFNSGGTDYMLLDGSSTDVTINGSSNLSLQTGGSNRLNITSAGFVGLGLTSPSSLLHLYTSTARNIPTLGNAGGHQIIQTGGVIATLMGVNANGNYWIQPQHINPGDSTVYSILLAPSGGNVGIGTTSPSEALDVVGTINVSSAIRSSGEIMLRRSGNELRLGSGVSADYSVFYTGGSERMRITSSGNVGIGNTDPDSKLKVTSSTNSSWATQIINSGSTDAHGLLVYTGASSTGIPFIVYSQASERMRITSGGKVLIGATSTTYGTLLGVQNTGSSSPVVHLKNANNTSGDSVIYWELTTNARNTNSYYLQAFDSGQDQLYIYGNGNIVNRNGSYGTLSDATLKENISDATPKLDDILQLKVRNFNLIGDSNKQIGFIAQEFEEVFPTMIDIDGKSGKKAIKTSVLVPMLVKAIQELKAELDTLKNK